MLGNDCFGIFKYNIALFMLSFKEFIMCFSSLFFVSFFFGMNVNECFKYMRKTVSSWSAWHVGVLTKSCIWFQLKAGSLLLVRNKDVLELSMITHALKEMVIGEMIISMCARCGLDL